jgi:hypothetical protein
MAAALSGVMSATLSDATMVWCRERTSAVRGGVRDDAAVGFTRLGGHSAPRIAPPSLPCEEIAAVKKQFKMGAHLRHCQDGPCCRPTSPMATAFCGLLAPRRHGHCPPWPPRLAPPCPGSPPRAAMATARRGLLAPPQPPCTVGLPRATAHR